MNVSSSQNFWSVPEDPTTEFGVFSFDDLAACSTPSQTTVNTYSAIMDSFYDFGEGGKNKPTPSESQLDTDFLDLLDPVNEQSLDLQALIQSTIGSDSCITGEAPSQLFPELLSKSELDQVNPTASVTEYQIYIQDESLMPQQILVDISKVPDSESASAAPVESVLAPELEAEYGEESQLVDDTIFINSFNTLPQVKTEPAGTSCSSRRRHSTAGSSTSSSAGGKITRPRRVPPKDSDEYRDRRDRNNVAVRKSRDKAKARQEETEKRVKELTKKNEDLTQRCDMLQKELNVLRSLFTNIGAKLPQEYTDFMASTSNEN